MRAQRCPRQLLVRHRAHILAHRRDPHLLREQARDGPEVGDGIPLADLGDHACAVLRPVRIEVAQELLAQPIARALGSPRPAAIPRYESAKRAHSTPFSPPLRHALPSVGARRAATTLGILAHSRR